MNVPTTNETWVVDAGADIVEKHATVGLDGLSFKERLLYWLWWADYMMRNSGDFANAETLDRDFQHEIVVNAGQIGLPFTKETFELPRAELQHEYFDRFERICDEIRNA